MYPVVFRDKAFTDDHFDDLYCSIFENLRNCKLKQPRRTALFLLGLYYHYEDRRKMENTMDN